MKKKTSSININAIIIGIILFCTFTFIAIRFDLVYELNDDTLIKDILSGSYLGTPSVYNIQMLYPINLLIAFLYKLFPQIAWYGILLYTFQFICITLIIYKFSNCISFQNRYVNIVTIFLVSVSLIGTCFSWMIFLQYSVTSGFLMSTAIFMFLTENKKILPVLPICLVALSFAVRTELCLMLFPFLCISGLWKWSNEKAIFSKENVKYYLSTIGIALSIMLLMLVTDKVAYSLNEHSESWHDYQRFFNERTILYDFYGLPLYSSEMGISEEQYSLILNYNFGFDESIDAEALHKVNLYQRRNLHHIIGSLYTRNTLREAVWVYCHNLIKLKKDVLGYLSLLLYLIILIASIKHHRFVDIFTLMCIFFARSSLFIYFYMIERVEDRVTFPIILSELTLLSGIIVTRKIEYKLHSKIGILLLLSITSAFIWYESYPDVVYNYSNRENAIQVNSLLTNYVLEHPDNYYYVDVYSTTTYKGAFISEKVFNPSHNLYKNYNLCGGWLTKSPTAMQKDNAGLANDYILFICYTNSDMSWMKKWFSSIGKDVTIDLIDNINFKNDTVYDVYKIY